MRISRDTDRIQGADRAAMEAMDPIRPRRASSNQSMFPFSRTLGSHTGVWIHQSGTPWLSKIIAYCRRQGREIVSRRKGAGRDRTLLAGGPASAEEASSETAAIPAATIPTGRAPLPPKHCEQHNPGPGTAIPTG